MKRLTGKALQKKVNELTGLSKKEIAKECGYVNDSGRVLLEQFYSALLQANGVELNPKGSVTTGRGRDRTYRTTVHKNGTIVIGKSYTEEMGLQPGDEFEIKLGYKHIHLSQHQADDSEDEQQAVA
ncbi:MAG: AbrB family transcriptional regulator [Leptolyngbyaceae cyanobacterium MO_188.B28]|nr:AbrB family transcriptional regulator [Leptolyngbyaceae cyanobacterium MO_188.B28]